ncbi:hypothetical protein AB1E18_004663 [Capra hircus]
MAQSASEAGGLAWGWDGDVDEDWEGAALTLLALAVVAATALALHWFGSAQDQEVPGPALRPSQVGAAGPALPPKHEVSGAVEGHGSGQGKPGPAGRGQGSPAAVGAQDQEPLGSGSLAAAASPPLKMPAGEGASGGALGPPETLQRKGKEARRSGSALPGGSKAEGSSAPLLIHFTPRDPGREVEVRGEAGGTRGKAPVHRAGRDSRPWQQGRGSPASRGQSPGSWWGQVDSGRSGCRRPKLDALSLGSVESVWDAAGAASSLPAGSRGLLFPQEPPPLCSLQARPLMGASERGLGESSPQAAQGLALDSAATAGEDKEAATLAPRESQGSPAATGGWPWVRREVLVTGSFSQAPGPIRESAAPPEEDRHGTEGLATRVGPGALEEAGAQPQQSHTETEGAAAAGTPSGPRGDRTEEKYPDLLLRGAAEPMAPLPPPEQIQPGSSPCLATRRDPQPVPRPRKRSLCEMSQSPKQEASWTAPGQHQGRASEAGPRPSGPGQGLGEKQEEARKLTGFLQRPGGWGVVEGPRKSRASAVALPRWLDLGSCLEALAFAQQHGDPGLAQETYAWMSDNLLHVLREPNLYRQLSGADRERIVSLRTGRGPAVLGALVLPGLYGASRSGLTRDSPAAEALALGPAALPPPAYLHVFHPGENSWRPLTRVPQEAPLRGCGLCTLHNYLFLAGGIRGSGAEAVCSNEVFCYNPLTDVWSQVRPMQQARAQLKLVALDGLLYAIGGECLYSMECYDPRADAWTPRAPLPAGAFPVAHEAVACQGDIYVTGGHLFHRLLRYSPTKDAWDECPYSASHRRSGDMVALGGFLYRFDLLRGVGAAVMRYNPVTSSWSRAAALPLPAPAPLRCAALGNTIYCLNHQVTATFTVSEGTAQFQAKELQPFPLGTKGVLCPFTLTLPARAPLQTAL